MRLEEQFSLSERFPKYEVSNFGRVVILSNGRELDPWSDKESGDLLVTLYRNGYRHVVKLARLVAEVFFANYTEDSFVGYQNGDQSDCTVLNLTLDPSKCLVRERGAS